MSSERSVSRVAEAGENPDMQGLEERGFFMGRNYRDEKS